MPFPRTMDEKLFFSNKQMHDPMLFRRGFPGPFADRRAFACAFLHNLGKCGNELHKNMQKYLKHPEKQGKDKLMQQK